MKVVVRQDGMLIDARIEMRDGGETMVVVPVTATFTADDLEDNSTKCKGMFRKGDVVTVKREVRNGYFKVGAGAQGVIVGIDKFGWGYIVKFEAIGPIGIVEMSIYGKDLSLVRR
ncbi:MAG: hypothetical protein Q4D30_01260 [Bacteroidales bacterium]|nr:hypothetical protein [Bacteroidales bacterium]